MVTKLNVKLVRDIRFAPFVFAGIVFLLLVGISLFGASYALYLNLQSSYALSYRRLNLADFIVPAQSIPTSVIAALRHIPGIHQVEGRFVEEVELKLPVQANRKVIGRIISSVSYTHLTLPTTPYV